MDEVAAEVDGAVSLMRTATRPRSPMLSLAPPQPRLRDGRVRSSKLQPPTVKMPDGHRRLPSLIPTRRTLKDWVKPLSMVSSRIRAKAMTSQLQAVGVMRRRRKSWRRRQRLEEWDGRRKSRSRLLWPSLRRLSGQ